MRFNNNTRQRQWCYHAEDIFIQNIAPCKPNNVYWKSRCQLMMHFGFVFCILDIKGQRFSDALPLKVVHF